ncbi:hypothetical protein B0J13DRAFT_457018 [Dactylonectria estremocensis]|uniref:Uncharacterized protein n=1 Tax=Dactylonectria estremocensis TaxID=1079267 RepID=A0A9P9II17_9HYPO|nr:hypothetical protein B0J13DRAFT_457018 [Dactylonectria estremocensis]
MTTLNTSRLENPIDFTNGGVLHFVGEGRPVTLTLDKTPSSVTQVLRAYFPSDIGLKARQTAALVVEKFTKATLSTSQDSEELIYGWSVENDVLVIGEESKTGKVLVVFVRWSSVCAPNEALETHLFQDNLGTIRNLPDLIKLDVFHGRSKLTLAWHSAGALK